MTTSITQRASVQCPLPQAATRLRDFFRAHGNQDGDTAQLSLWVNANIPGIPTPIRLEQSVIVTIQQQHPRGEMAPSYHVQWAPAESGPFPLFAGALHVDANDDYDSFDLVLQGTYEPPLGLFGAAFDRVLGARIAATCARNLLSRIAEEIEGRFAADEASKHALVDANSCKT